MCQNYVKGIQKVSKEYISQVSQKYLKSVPKAPISIKKVSKKYPKSSFFKVSKKIKYAKSIHKLLYKYPKSIPKVSQKYPKIIKKHYKSLL